MLIWIEKTGSVVMVTNIGWRCQHTVYNVKFWRMAGNIFDFQCVYVKSRCSIFCTEIDQTYTVYNFMHNLIKNCHVRVEKHFFSQQIWLWFHDNDGINNSNNDDDDDDGIAIIVHRIKDFFVINCFNLT